MEANEMIGISEISEMIEMASANRVSNSWRLVFRWVLESFGSSFNGR